MLEFDSETIHIACVAKAETVRGLQWALDRLANSSHHFQLVACGLTDLKEKARGCELVFLALDLGQPVPLQHLKDLDLFGICAFTQPTPQQLLAVFEKKNWVAMNWDGVSYERVIQKVEEYCVSREEEIKERHFIEACKGWTERSLLQPVKIEWVNAPAQHKGLRQFVLDPKRGFIVIGGSRSAADVKLIADGGAEEAQEWGEIRFINGAWSFRPFVLSVPLQGLEPDSRIKVGDHLEIFKNLLSFKTSSAVQEFLQIAQKIGLNPHRTNIDILQHKIPTLSELVREFLLSGLNGEIQVTSGLKNASIFVADSKVVYVVTGSVQGAKALLRVFSWEKLSWKFIQDSEAGSAHEKVSLDLSQFDRLYNQWKKYWEKVKNFVPPPQIILKANAAKYFLKEKWSNKEYAVIAAVCEYSRVRDILNHCHLNDVEIYEKLIELRKEGLVAPTKEIEA